MHSFATVAAALAAGAALFAAPVAAQLDPIVIKGNHFFYKTNGTEFFLKGVAYQQDLGGPGSTGESANGTTNYVDSLADSAGCDRDIPLLQQLGTNVIRVYALDPTKDHSHCMTALQNAGIYLIADLGSPSISITSDEPQWNVDIYNRYTSVVDAFSNYTNVIGFFAGNEVANLPNQTDSLAFVKAAVRDMKSYVKSKSRPIYIGYASSDVDIRVPLEDYLECGSQDTSIDFFGYNIYSWCGDATYSSSQYEARTNELMGYPVPAFFAEYGCNTQGTRTFEEADALYGPNMTGVWSGGIVYEYFQDANDYGLVSVSGSTASKLPDFSNLASRIASVSPSLTNSASFTPTNTALRSCPSDGGNFTASPTLAPTINEQLCSCMVQSLSCVAKGSIAGVAQGELFDYICGSGQGSAGIDCAGISGNGSTGQYGAYSMCSAQDRLSWAFNAYYQAQSGSNKNTACSFNGNATTQSSQASGSCSSLVSQAGGAAGTGTSTAQPNNSGAAASSSKSAAGAVTVPSVDMGIVKMGIYVVFAVFAGAGVIFL